MSPLEFTIYWTDGYGRASGRTTVVRARDLDAAIMRACNLLKRPRGDRGALWACGFYVHNTRTRKA